MGAGEPDPGRIARAATLGRIDRAEACLARVAGGWCSAGFVSVCVESDVDAAAFAGRDQDLAGGDQRALLRRGVAAKQLGPQKVRDQCRRPHQRSRLALGQIDVNPRDARPAALIGTHAAIIPDYGTSRG